MGLVTRCVSPGTGGPDVASMCVGCARLGEGKMPQLRRLLGETVPAMARSFESAIKLYLAYGKDGERFTLDASARPALLRALDQDLSGSDALADVSAGLRLAAAMDGKLASPSVARMIRAVLREDPRAVRLLRGRRKQQVSVVDAARRFARGEGRAAVVRAPVVDQRAPAGAIPLRTMLPTDPQQIARARGQTTPSGARKARS